MHLYRFFGQKLVLVLLEKGEEELRERTEQREEKEERKKEEDEGDRAASVALCGLLSSFPRTKRGFVLPPDETTWGSRDPRSAGLQATCFCLRGRRKWTFVFGEDETKTFVSGKDNSALLFEIFKNARYFSK